MQSIYACDMNPPPLIPQLWCNGDIGLIMSVLIHISTILQSTVYIIYSHYIIMSVIWAPNKVSSIWSFYYPKEYRVVLQVFLFKVLSLHIQQIKISKTTKKYRRILFLKLCSQTHYSIQDHTSGHLNLLSLLIVNDLMVLV